MADGSPDRRTTRLAPGNARTSVIMPTAMMAWVTEEARRQGLSFSAVIRHAVGLYQCAWPYFEQRQAERAVAQQTTTDSEEEARRDD